MILFPPCALPLPVFRALVNKCTDTQGLLVNTLLWLLIKYFRVIHGKSIKSLAYSCVFLRDCVGVEQEGGVVRELASGMSREQERIFLGSIWSYYKLTSLTFWFLLRLGVLLRLLRGAFSTGSARQRYRIICSSSFGSLTASSETSSEISVGSSPCPGSASHHMRRMEGLKREP